MEAPTWRGVKDNVQFDRVLDMIRGVKALDLEACCTLGMVTGDQARRMKEAGLDAYNHNLDSSEAFYDRIISTRSYRDRLDTLANVRRAGITVCCGGIVGMGETEDDRIALLHTLANLPEPPESVPINALVAVGGTPLADRPQVAIWEMVRTIATARVLMPRSMVRLSAGRIDAPGEDPSGAPLLPCAGGQLDLRRRRAPHDPPTRKSTATPGSSATLGLSPLPAGEASGVA